MNEIKSITFDDVTVNKSMSSGIAIDLGLSVKWAPFNLGADENGRHCNGYAWGSLYSQTKVCQSEFGKESLDVFDPKRIEFSGNKRCLCCTARDIVRKEWGGNWRMPTANELRELANRCEWRYSIEDGWVWYVVTGPSGNSIRFPACYETKIYGTQTYFSVWSGDLSEKNNEYAQCLSISHQTVYTRNQEWNTIQLSDCSRNMVLCIRAVLPKD